MRTVKEWIGKTDDSMPPPRVRERISGRQGDRCALCTRPFSERLTVQIDHKVPLILGGENRERNMQAVCAECHKDKTAAEVKIKSKVAKARQSKLGIKTKKHNWNPRGAKFNWQTGRYELQDDAQ